MAALCARGLARARLLPRLKAALVLFALVSPAAAAPPPALETIVVMLDQARLLQLPERAANVVVGNPIVADLSIQPGGLAVVTGKSYGATNLIVTDKKGAVLMEKTVEVTGAADKNVVVYRGADRETYSCTPECSPRLTLGDSTDYFNKTLAEITTRNTQSAAAGALTSGH
jgi:hypothetical protein